MRRARPSSLIQSLERIFPLVVVDWDGTAVAARGADATALGTALDRLLRAGARVAVVTGTRFSHVDGRVAPHLRGPHVARFAVAANRGAELYGHDASGEPYLLRRRRASPDEEAALDRAVEALAGEIGAVTNLDLAVVRDRLNRRKLDLYPSWEAPPKDRIGELVAAVEARLGACGWRGGLAEVARRADALARAAGIPDPRVTSDGKHVEVGISDKADAIEAILAWAGVPGTDALLVGDEVGPVGGIPGSDARMRSGRAADAVLVSVGPEPEGVPDGVLHLGGGPPRLLRLLHAQIALRVELGGDAARGPPPAVAPTEDPTRRLVEPAPALLREHEIESLHAVGNGVAGVRGAVSEGNPRSNPGTRLAGAWTRADGLPALAAAPEWTGLVVGVADLPLRSPATDRRVLDLDQGIAWRHARHEDPLGRVTELRICRFASLADRRVLAERVEIHTVNWSGDLTVGQRVRLPPEWRLRASGDFAGPGVAAVASTLRGDAPEPTRPAPDPRDADGHGFVAAGAARGGTSEEHGRFQGDPEDDAQTVETTWRVPTRPGSTWRLDRVCAVARLPLPGEPDSPDLSALAAATLAELDRAAADHAAAFRARTAAMTPTLDGDVGLQRALAFASHHLVAAANPLDEHVSVGARGLTGATYMGHVFWDTELWLLPVYTLCWPRAARALVSYRWHTLDAARSRAAQRGWRGALYAWESADTGADVTPSTARLPDGRIVPVRAGELEHHVSAAVAWAAWRYASWTGDEMWLRECGLEILLETARFWASRGVVEADGRFHIRHVTGPDEYHDDVDDDAYTNGMAAWNLRAGARAARLAARRWPDALRALAARTGLDADEPARWAALADAMYDGLDEATGRIEQFAGYFAREDIDLAALEPRSAPVDVLLGPERVAASQIAKQASVVLLLQLFPDRFPPEVHRACFGWYDARTAHGSSLSPPVHALAAARIGRLDRALHHLRETAAIDLDDRRGNAAGGVHVGALGGLWQAVVFGLAGLRFTPNGPRLDPHLPSGIERIAFPFAWRERRWRAEVRPGAARLVEEPA